MGMNDLPYALKSLRLLLLVHKPASNLRLLRQVFSSTKGFSGCFIVVVRVMHFKQARYPIGCSAAKGQERHWPTMRVLKRRGYDCLVLFLIDPQYLHARSRHLSCTMLDPTLS